MTGGNRRRGKGQKMKYRIESEVTMKGVDAVINYTFEHEFADGVTAEEIEKERRRRIATTFILAKSKAVKVERVG